MAVPVAIDADSALDFILAPGRAAQIQIGEDFRAGAIEKRPDECGRGGRESPAAAAAGALPNLWNTVSPDRRDDGRSGSTPRPPGPRPRSKKA